MAFLHDALVSIHDSLWDDERDLVSTPPGAVPTIDLTPFNLHSIRETALGAFFDLQRGNTERAQRALRKVLTFQYLDAWQPWYGTFRVTDLDQDPPEEGAEEWVHYDPNWRQFIGCIFAMILLGFEETLDPDLVTKLRESMLLCVEGEPQDRIPDWYTNINVLHAWLCARVGAVHYRDDLIDRGERLALQVLERLREQGDVDEYNSPSYDGIDLLVAVLSQVYPPTPFFETFGIELQEAIQSRLEEVTSDSLHEIAGPYLRSYGMSLSQYVSLAGVWMALDTDDPGYLPATLDVSTPHVHDLFFYPLIAWLDELSPIGFHFEAYAERLDHVVGEIVSTSLVTENYLVGFERGRTPAFSISQYVPFVCHVRDSDGEQHYLALQFGENVSRIDVNELNAQSFGVDIEPTKTAFAIKFVSDLAPEQDGNGLSFASISLLIAQPYEIEFSEPLVGLFHTMVKFSAERAELVITLR